MKFIVHVLAFALGYFGYQWYRNANPDPRAERALDKLEAVVDKFCACSRFDKDCMRRTIAKGRKLLPEFQQLDRQGVRVTKKQRARGEALKKRISTCHFK